MPSHLRVQRNPKPVQTENVGYEQRQVDIMMRKFNIVYREK